MDGRPPDSPAASAHPATVGASVEGRRRWFGLAAATVSAALVLLAVACGGDASDAAFSEQGGRGQQLSRGNGCAACHGVDGQGGVGPPFVGLAGSEVELADGTIVVADDEYLVRAILEPSADLRAGYDVQMPSNRLDDAEVADVVAYINELAARPSDGS